MSDPQVAAEVASHAVSAAPVLVKSILPLIAVFLPLLIPLPMYLVGRKSETLRNIIAILTTLASFTAIASLYPYIAAGQTIVYTAPILMLDGMTFYVDATSFI
ncbi:MAG TPA: hypothetical protein ENH51_04150, partial [Euryarchaeota archaeon]|nr:hypothetical protein [Euryarchaeota archaeon]